MNRTDDLNTTGAREESRWDDSHNEEERRSAPLVRHVYAPSDVWNQRSRNVAGEHQTPVPAAAGPNFACASIERRSDGPPDEVLAHFLFADFGMGCSFRDLASSHAIVADRQAVVAQPWALPAEVSRRLCLAVEMGTPSRVPSALRGRSGDGGALHAQRNVAVMPMSAAGELFAAVRNSGVERRDLVLRMSAQDSPDISISVVAPETLRTKRGESFALDPKTPIVLRRMKPGETRWLRIANARGLLRVFEEREGNVVNGFTIVPRALDRDELLDEAVLDLIALCSRVEGVEQWIERAVTAREKLDHTSFIRLFRGSSAAIISAVNAQTGPMVAESFELAAAEASLRDASDETLLDAQLAYAAVADAALTAAAKQNGDVADILHNMLWQEALFTGPLAKTPEAKAILEISSSFATAFASRTIGVEEYPRVAASLMPRLRRVFPRLAHVSQATFLRATPALAQRLHRRLLLALARKLWRES